MKFRVSPGKPSFNIDFLITNSDLKTQALIPSWSNRNQRQWVKPQPFKFLCVSLMLCLIQGDNYQTKVSKTVCLNGNTVFGGKKILLLNFLEFFSKWKNKPSPFHIFFFFFFRGRRRQKRNEMQYSSVLTLAKEKASTLKKKGFACSGGWVFFFTLGYIVLLPVLC